MRCAYCGKEEKGTKEHVISKSVLDLFPECTITYDDIRDKCYDAELMIKDVCPTCNNKRISYIDSYANEFIGRYFTRNYSLDDKVEIEYDYTMIQKMLLKYAFNDLRLHKGDCSFFDEEMLHYLMNEDDNIPKENVTVLCGLAVNVSPFPETLEGNFKLKWSKEPLLYSNSIIQHIDFMTGEKVENKEASTLTLPDLRASYIFKFNSVQFLLMCWDKTSDKVNQNNILLSHLYPYHLMKQGETKAELPVCTNIRNFYKYKEIHISQDGLFQLSRMLKYIDDGMYGNDGLVNEKFKEFEKAINKRYYGKKDN